MSSSLPIKLEGPQPHPVPCPQLTRTGARFQRCGQAPCQELLMTWRRRAWLTHGAPWPTSSVSPFQLPELSLASSPFLPIEKMVSWSGINCYGHNDYFLSPWPLLGGPKGWDIIVGCGSREKGSETFVGSPKQWSPSLSLPDKRPLKPWLENTCPQLREEAPPDQLSPYCHTLCSVSREKGKMGLDLLLRPHSDCCE